MNRSAQRGITLIEVLVGMGIIAMLIGVALPSFRVWMQNTQVRTAAEAVLNGLQTARNEAIRRNLVFEFTIHHGSGWDICPSNDAYPCATPVMARSQDEGSTNASVTTLPAGADTVAFNGLGRVVGNANGNPSMTQIDIGNPLLTAADVRAMRIMIPPGGAIRLCDPKVGPGDPRTC